MPRELPSILQFATFIPTFIRARDAATLGVLPLMNLKYSVRSKFFDLIDRVVVARRANLAKGLSVALGPGGYAGDVHVVIHRQQTASFGSDWAAPDRTRFPARIRAAATVLRDNGCYGRFRIVHARGTLTIIKV